MSRTIFAILAVLVATGTSYGANKSLVERCPGCHQSKAGGSIIHGPLMERQCGPCHSRDLTTHGALKAEVGQLQRNQAQLCYDCHHEFTGRVVHKPVREGKCLLCHGVHTSPHRVLLRSDPVTSLCFQCHERNAFEKNHAHAGKAACLSCHAPHDSTTAHLLKDVRYGEESVR